jgi:hypothetical protein
MGIAFDRDELLWAFDRLGRAAIAAGVKLEIAVYGGSALMLASNFRFSTEDVDVARIEQPWPEWLVLEAARIAADRNWAEHWLNDAVTFHLSQLAQDSGDHVEFGTFPRDEGPVGLIVHVPTAPYMLALKLKALRVNEPRKGEQEGLDILNLMKVAGIETADEAVAVLARYFPKSAGSPGKLRFVLKHLESLKGAHHAPRYPVGSSGENKRG